MRANLWDVNLRGADLGGVDFWDADLQRADLKGANLIGASFGDARLPQANLAGAYLKGVSFHGADLSHADLSGADLSNTVLINANFLRTKVDGANISNSKIYGVNVWDLEGEFKEQNQLIITLDDTSAITVDNIKVAQFIYLILNNKEVRDVLNTLTSKTVLILGRFALPERKVVLDALRNKLREYDLLPIVFDFERPDDKDFTETIKTLAGMCYFVIADVTNPKSSPLELQATVPDYQIPFVPIIQEGESPFAMMVDLQKKYDWVLDTISYKDGDQLIRILKKGIIDRAMQKHDELRLIKAQMPTVISASQFEE
ncbi:pentapeptide repeat-containing protein [Candidatus Villigracilis affinis]|uniref:pentapeptide repeat-containing protein n=1 Tax=Candidatus Villigracilis affinis TaxID=3140682 RepID=UPI0031EFE400